MEVGGEKRPAFLLFEDEFPKLGSSLKTKNTVTVSKCGGAQQLRGAPVSLSFMGTSQVFGWGNDRVEEKVPQVDGAEEVGSSELLLIVE